MCAALHHYALALPLARRSGQGLRKTPSGYVIGAPGLSLRREER